MSKENLSKLQSMFHELKSTNHIHKRLKKNDLYEMYVCPVDIYPSPPKKEKELV